MDFFDWVASWLFGVVISLTIVGVLLWILAKALDVI